MKKIFLLFVSVLCCFSMFGQIVPYLQTPTSHSIWVNWRTASGTESIVYFGESSESLAQTASGSAELFSGVKDNNYSYVYHSVKLDGLASNTTYYYKVKSGAAESAVYSFKTQPELGEGGVYRFIIMGDHQLQDDRYVRLMTAAKNIAEAKYGAPIEQYINMITNVGDQVDNGSYKQYDIVHFSKSELLSPNLPIMTIVGNHETYKGEENPMLLYDKHFPHYKNIEYKGIKSNSNYYYAMQQGRALFLMLSSDHPGTTQKNWAKRVIDEAKEDADIDWILSYNHRPLQAEQYVGDISVWVRDEIMPMLNATEKSVMNVAGHHHLYHRGQLRDYPTYHIITGGAAWNQRWGDSTEQDFDDVQKTIDYWPFQIVELNSATKTMSVETYVIGNEAITLPAPVLVDEFHRKFGKAKPNKPSITNPPAAEIELPYTFESSAYSTSTDELYNSVQFQAASDAAFTKLEFDLIRDYENLYGKPSGSALYVDLHKDVDVFKQTLTKDNLYNGTHYIRVRHRDRNLEWSEWSDVVTFTTINGSNGAPSITTSKRTYQTGENIDILFKFLPNESGQWIGIYKEKNKYPDNTSEEWGYINQVSGTVSIPFTKADGVHYAVAFRDGGYKELARTDLFYIGKVPVLSTEKTVFKPNEAIKVSFSNIPNLTNDWIGVYKEGQTTDPDAGGVTSTLWTYIRDANGTGEHTFAKGLPAGDYFITYLMQDKYFEPGERVYISVDVANNVRDVVEHDFSVFFDAKNDLIHISALNSGKRERADIYSVNGVLKKSVFFTENTQIDMSTQASGIYILSIGNSLKNKIVKK